MNRFASLANLPFAMGREFDLGHFSFWDMIIKSTLALALTALACELLLRQSAALRHRVWVLGLCASLLIPFFSYFLPHYPLALLPSVSQVQSVVPGPARDDLVSFDLNDPSSQPIGSEAGATDQHLKKTAPQSDPNRQVDADPIASSSGLADLGANLLSLSRKGGFEALVALLSFFATFTAAALFLIAFIRQAVALRRLRKIDEPAWTQAVEAAKAAMGLNRPIDTLESDQATVPAVIGAWNPCLIVPVTWRDWSRAQRQCILLHELAHVQRRDVAAQLLGRLVLFVYWFNPLAWYAVRQLRVERELASDDCVLLAGQTASDYAEQLLHTLRSYRRMRPLMGVAMAHSARLDHRVRAILDPRRRREPIGSRAAILMAGLVGLACIATGALTLTNRPLGAMGAAEGFSPSVAGEKATPVWREGTAVEFPGALPVSVAFSADGKTLLTGDTRGEVMALIFDREQPTYRWKVSVEGAHAVSAYSADHKSVYATTEHGVRILDAASGKEVARVEAKNSQPTALGVFPDKPISEGVTGSQLVFGNARGYFIKSWAQGKLPDGIGTIETSTIHKDAKPSDEAAVPLAVDPKGRSAIMTGPVDSTGEVAGAKGRNVLWAYVCGDYGAGSPGNRVMIGHTANVVCAAWAKEGSVAVTGDADGRVILWDANTMKEKERIELGGRVAALAISDDGMRVAAYALGSQGEVVIWENDNSLTENNGKKENLKTVEDSENDKKPRLKTIHKEWGSFNNLTSHASLSFSPDGKRLAGCAIDKAWLSNLGRLTGKVRTWTLDAAPQAQSPPKQIYSKSLAKGASTEFVLMDNQSIIRPASRTGAVDLRGKADGDILARIGLGSFAIGKLKRSYDRKWIAIEQHPLTNDRGIGIPPPFDVAIHQEDLHASHGKIPQCSQLIDISSRGQAVAVVRENRIELWDAANAKLLKNAPFRFTRIDAASFSPGGDLLALCDSNDLVLWHWEKNQEERIPLGQSVGSLAFSPNGNFLAEAFTSGEKIQLRDLKTRKIVRTLNSANKPSSPEFPLAPMIYTQGGRVLIAGGTKRSENQKPSLQTIDLWDMENGTLVHQMEIAFGHLRNLDVFPNGSILLATIEDSEGVKLNGWSIDSTNPIRYGGDLRPPAASPR